MDALTREDADARRAEHLPPHHSLARFALPEALLRGDGRPHVPPTFRSSADPAARFVLQPRDLHLIGLTAWSRELKGEAAHQATFQASAAVFSRRLGILEREGLLTFERYLGVAFNRLRVTARGREVLAETDTMDPSDVFVPRAFLPPKDMTHHYLVAETALLLAEDLPVRWDAIFPSWHLQRRCKAEAIPDVLAVQASEIHPPGRLWAFEIDLGGERLRTTFLPKLHVLATLLQTWANGGRARIFVLTRGTKRLEALRAGVAALGLPVEVVTLLLPKETGRAGLQALRSLLRPPATATSQPSRT